MNIDNVNGNQIKISQEVLASISRFAAEEVDGVKSVYSPGIASKIPSGGISITIVDDVVFVDIYIIILMGYNVVSVSSSLQENIKNAIQSMTGLAVSEVNVIVSGVSGSQSE